MAQQRWVIKIGSALLTNDGQGVDLPRIHDWVAQMAKLQQSGIEIILVSSGAVAAGIKALGWSKRPTEMPLLQAAAAVGQASLVQQYQQFFNQHQLHSAQILLTHDDLSNRTRYLNARATLRALIEHSIVPIINENDTVVTDEIRFGDNDTLGALVANLVEADALIILTDQDGVFDADPRGNPNAKLIHRTKATDPMLLQVAGGGGELGRGGMITKIRAALLAARSGAATCIVGGRIEQVLTRLAAQEHLGTWLEPDTAPVAARKQWLAGHLRTKGQLCIDAGAVSAIKDQGKSLLAVGVKQVQGTFERGEAVSLMDPEGKLIAIGLSNYSSLECHKIAGISTEKFQQILGYVLDSELMHRDNLVIL